MQRSSALVKDMYIRLWSCNVKSLWLIFLAFFVAFPMGSQAQDDVTDPDFDDTLREKYANSRELPDAIAFLIAIGTVSELYKKSPSLAQSIVRNRMSMNSAQSAEFLTKLISEHESLESDISSNIIDLLCSQGAPKVSGPDVYTALDAADDAEEQIARKHLTSFRQELAAEQADRLDQWIEESKESTVYIKINHRKQYEQQDIDPDAIVPLMCGR